ncbi:MAG: nucleotidyltransferase [Candidatus Moraniibacteriota bacterium]
MPISDEQLTVWSSAPSPTEMGKIQNTYRLIKEILGRNLPVDEIKRKFNLSSFKYEVYLQGSYANHTNVRYDSDVDIVVQLNHPFNSDKTQLSPVERSLYDASHSNTEYEFLDFKTHVYEALKSELTEREAHWGDKCINVDANTSRIEADVIPCLQFRLYKRFISYDKQSFIEGIKFFDTSDNTAIINFPKIHLRNCEAKNVDTEGKFKDLVRIYKNIRNDLMEDGVIGEDIAPSYYIENLLYNCTSPCFDGSYGNCMITSLQFIFDAIETGRITGFICANEQDALIDKKTWNLGDLISFMNALGNYYISGNTR